MSGLTAALFGRRYDRGFYDSIQAQARRSAAAIVPIVQDLLTPGSVLDVGCGRGDWLAEFARAGVRDTFGMDQDAVDPRDLVIPPDRYRAVDLAQRFDLGRRFDLAICLEVAEHLPPAAAVRFVEDLTRHAPRILFSAAVPGQGGTGHLNEQWPEYWAVRFASFGYRTVDVIRPRIWWNQEIPFWYRQNMLLFLSDDVPNPPGTGMYWGPLSVVHPVQFPDWRRSAGVFGQTMTLGRLIWKRLWMR